MGRRVHTVGFSAGGPPAPGPVVERLRRSGGSDQVQEGPLSRRRPSALGPHGGEGFSADKLSVPRSALQTGAFTGCPRRCRAAARCIERARASRHFPAGYWCHVGNNGCLRLPASGATGCHCDRHRREKTCQPLPRPSGQILQGDIFFSDFTPLRITDVEFSIFGRITKTKDDEKR